MSTRIHWTIISILTIMLLVTLFGSNFAFTQSQMEEVTLTVVKGNPVAGKKCFQDFLCISCHRVAKEKAFPKPIAGYEGPIIGPKQAAMTIQELSESILIPSHKIPQEVRKQIYGDKSPMTDYSDAITVRQLMDLIAYIRSLN